MCMQKGAQIALFLILGFVILIGVGFLHFISSNISSENVRTEAIQSSVIVFSTENVRNFLELCFKNLATEGIDYASLQGGYYVLPQKSYSEGIINTAFYFYEDQSLFPKIEVFENSLSEYIKLYANYCFNNLKNFTEIMDIDYKIENVSTKILKDQIIIDIAIPVKIKVTDITFEVNNFQIIIGGNRLYDIYEFNKYLIDKQIEDKYSLCISCIINNATENNFFVDVTNVGNDTLVFNINYNDTKTNSLRKFVFANKYRKISCQNLPFDADEYLTNQLISNCLEQQMQSYNYSLYVQDPIILIAQVGIPFESQINAKGLNLQFESFNDLFNIDQTTGLINFTPTPDQEGEHDILLFVRDSLGNKELRLINLTVLR